MSRMILICSFAALLGSCGAESADQNSWAQARLACADVGIAPGSGAFSQCVTDLHDSLWAQRNLEDS
jgi:hypothetical protein